MERDPFAQSAAALAFCKEVLLQPLTPFGSFAMRSRRFLYSAPDRTRPGYSHSAPLPKASSTARYSSSRLFTVRSLARHFLELGMLLQ